MRKPDLSLDQCKAISHTYGPALVIAGPGSGKTTVIVKRILNLIRNEHIDPSNILVITFSKPAALEMQRRFEKQAGGYEPVTFGTFHSIFYNIIRHHMKNVAEGVATDALKRNILKKVLRDINLSDNTESEYLDLIIKRISYYKNSSLRSDDRTICDLDTKSFLRIYELYNEHLKAASKIDFEDMMLMCKKLLSENKQARLFWRERFKFILIDEFQDINELQFDIVRLLLTKENNFFAVGDDDQSIYGFRGSKPEIMREVDRYFKNLTTIKLTCNYRSSSSIVKASDAVIKQNTVRFEKHLHTENDIGEAVRIMAFKDEESQFEQLVKTADMYGNKTGTNLKGNVAVLCRTNLAVSRIAREFMKRKIDCHVTQKPYDPFESVIYTDFTHYLRLSYSGGEFDANDLIPVMNKPLRYISRSMINKKVMDITLLKGLYQDKEYVLRALKKLEYDLNMIRKMDMFSAFNYFRRVIGYDEYMLRMSGDNEERYEIYTKQADLLMFCLKDLTTYEAMIEHAVKQSQNMEARKTAKVNETGIYIMTYHASKGLEFDTVIMPGLMEGEIPSKKSITKEAIEEERRMFYVAMTRAKTKLIMSYIVGKNNEKHIKSRFLEPVFGEAKTIIC
ncbi:MAG: ATP-dependent helicase [Lachnospiraceae bacterium]|nr:ATP-dependent helicase [Lachnospiraceae bacterium]